MFVQLASRGTLSLHFSLVHLFESAAVFQGSVFWSVSVSLGLLDEFHFVGREVIQSGFSFRYMFKYTTEKLRKCAMKYSLGCGLLAI